MHRDLKPENLLLDRNHNIKIVDFGLSNTYKTGGTLQTACGSPCYAAPEMIAGHAYEGLKVDIWSCGVILFAMLCGYLPFDDTDTQILYKKIMEGDFSIPSHVSSEARDLLKRILVTDPNKRFMIEDIRRHRWFNMYSEPRHSQGVIVGYHQIPIDEDILQEVERFGHDMNKVKSYLENNKHNKMTTTYYLLLLKAINAGYISPADINNPNFRLKLLDGVEERIEEPIDPEEARKRREIEDLKKFKAQMDKDQKLNTISNKNEEPSQTQPDIFKRDINHLHERERKKEHVKITRGSGRNPEEDPPSALINKNHNIIEKRTRKPNIAKLNNTTVMSIEDGKSVERHGRGSRIGNDSVSPVTKIRTSSNNKTNIQQKIISNKLRELNNAIPDNTDPNMAPFDLGATNSSRGGGRSTNPHGDRSAVGHRRPGDNRSVDNSSLINDRVISTGKDFHQDTKEYFC